MVDSLKWTIQGQRGEVRYPVREFETKRQAVQAMEADRQQKTQVNRDGRNYRFTVKE
jgi:hypothetical protein